MIKAGIESTSLCTSHRTGIANYTFNLIDQFLNNPAFNKEIRPSLLYKLSRYKKREERYLPTGAEVLWHYGKVLPFNNKFDILHSPDSVFLSRTGSKKVVTVHDLAIFKEQNKIEGYTNDKFREKQYAFLKKISIHADALITVSESTKNDLLEMFDIADAKVTVTHLGSRFHSIDADVSCLKDFQIESKKYLLFAGAISIRKNILSIIKAYKHSGLYSGYKLVLAGAMSMGHETILEEIRKNGLEKHIVITGFVSDGVLKALYENARAFVFSTYYEGFGLPIVEAMNAGVPVLIGNKGAAPEIAGGHALVCDPFDVDSIAEGMKRTLDLADEKKLSDAKQFAAGYTWENCASKTVGVYRSLL